MGKRLLNMPCYNMITRKNYIVNRRWKISQFRQENLSFHSAQAPMCSMPQDASAGTCTSLRIPQAVGRRYISCKLPNLSKGSRSSSILQLSLCMCLHRGRLELPCSFGFRSALVLLLFSLTALRISPRDFIKNWRHLVNCLKSSKESSYVRPPNG